MQKPAAQLLPRVNDTPRKGSGMSVGFTPNSMLVSTREAAKWQANEPDRHTCLQSGLAALTEY